MAIDTRTGKGENAAPLRHRFPFFDNKYYEPERAATEVGHFELFLVYRQRQTKE